MSFRFHAVMVIGVDTYTLLSDLRYSVCYVTCTLLHGVDYSTTLQWGLRRRHLAIIILRNDNLRWAAFVLAVNL